MKNWQVVGVVVVVVFAFVLLLGGLMVGCPHYDVWQQGMAGQAALKKAEQEKQIMIEQARAEKDAASLRAAAINILGAAAQKYPEYRKQEFMGAFADALQSDSIEKIIFVPTEANIPIVEAGRSIK